MTNNREIINVIEEKFIEQFGEKGRIFFAPSRINIIGEHIDYNGGKVLPCAIEIGTFAMAKKNDENKLRLYSINEEFGGEVNLDNLDFDKSLKWMNYPAGMAKILMEEGKKLGGIDAVVYGNISTGSGLSSSASLEMLFGEIYNVLFDLGVSRVDMSILGMKTENSHFGLQTGIMDQFAISLGKENSAILLDTATLDYEYVNVDLGENILVILNTKKPRELVESKYNERRAETQKGLEIIQEFADIENLAQLDGHPREQELIDKIKDEVIRRRVLHVVEENKRVNNMIKAMSDKDFEMMGKILDESHESLKNLYEVTGLELDSIVEGARKCPSTLGARMTGAGFSGCAIALVNKDSLYEFEEIVLKYYKEKTGIDGEIIISDIAGGPREII
ncbi:MAG: galactokinase [Tissierellia bacterium]|nr:galactokinase [Tissierellia bacterium]